LVGTEMSAPCHADKVRQITIVNSRGLHARAAAKFVKLAGTYNAEVTVVKNDVEVSGSSIMGLMMLAAAPGCELELRARGPAASAALAALADLVANKFDEDG
jgi:phosphocarrier protein